MKRLYFAVLAVMMMFVGCSAPYDDSAIWEKFDEMEQEHNEMQEQIDAQQTLLNALANNLSIVSITPTEEGFILTFTDGSTITIKHGEKGEKGDKGDTGAQGEKGDKGDTGEKGEQGEKGDTGAQGEKGDKGDTGEKGEQGEKGEDGADGKDGENGADGKDGQDGKDGEDGDSFFQSVAWDDEYVYFTLADGTVITIPLSKPENNEIWYTSTDGEIVEPYRTSDFGANIISNTYSNGRGVITFDGEVTKIGEMAFANCGKLTSITIPNSVTSIEYAAFGDCGNLANVTIPKSVTSIGYYAFVECDNLIEFRGKYASEDGRCWIVDGVLNFFAPAGLTEYTIPNSVTSIGNSAFGYCRRLTSIIIPDSVTEIGEEAFYFCDSLTSITIPDSVTEIGDYAFSGCLWLTNFYGKFASEDGRCLIIDGVLHSFAPRRPTQYTIPNSVTSIGDGAFYHCDSLTSVTIPEGVTSIGERAFSECWSLTSITIPEGVTSIGERAFSYCSSLANITIPEGVTEIGNHTFSYCYSLTSIAIPDSVISIGACAFSNCSNLTSITIPDSVTEIEDMAFAECESLTSVYCKPTTPPSGSTYSMFGNNAEGRKIYVPAESVEAYKAAEGWSEYADNIVGYDFE